EKPQNDIINWLKWCLIQSPILQYSDYSKLFVLFTNTSYQELEHIIAYVSRTLTPAKSNYSIVELEYLAVI
ncbi:1254_t:CDS:2, partial [Gigaspora margarita]